MHIIMTPADRGFAFGFSKFYLLTKLGLNIERVQFVVRNYLNQLFLSAV